ncbi:rarD protein [Desulfitobacterium dichloroeliminans LMG P-21439]|uniref:RarD protein n=1 Tax=Desulfitobacterium dichloroeliminans (strain LMG P-21439 / DCA1) TaxID=871963 RepID=L0F4E8_DESDL|nr:rarD protein [Desulfitobacterium dichloroeliminans LMG P-21439]
MEVKSSKTGVLYAFAAYIVWGLLPIYWKTLQGVPALEILAHRIVWSFAFVTMLIVLKKQWGRVGSILRDRSKLLGLVLSALLITANWYIYIWAVNSNKVVEASLGYYFNPLLVVLIGIIVLGERIDRWQIASLALAAIGVLILAFEYGRIPWISLGLAVTFALYGLAKRLVNVDSLLGLALETAVVAPIALIYLWVGTKSGGVIGDYGMSKLLLLMGAGIVTAIPLLWFANAAKSVPFATIGFIQYLSPTLNLLLGVLVFHEEFTSTHAWSFGFIWVALAVYSISRIYGLRRANLSAVQPLQGK